MRGRLSRNFLSSQTPPVVMSASNILWHRFWPAESRRINEDLVLKQGMWWGAGESHTLRGQAKYSKRDRRHGEFSKSAKVCVVCRTFQFFLFFFLVRLILLVYLFISNSLINSNSKTQYLSLPEWVKSQRCVMRVLGWIINLCYNCVFFIFFSILK